MAVLAIRCPNCGSAAASTQNPNEYVCTNCQTRFQIVRPSDATVVTDIRAHHCTTCGRPVQTLQSFKCTECGKADFCESCVTPVPSLGARRFVCRTCVQQKGWACATCGDYAGLVCGSCPRRSCEKHSSKIFGFADSEATWTELLFFFDCPTCGKLCSNCVETKKGFFSDSFFCRKCRHQLQPVKQPAKACIFCKQMILATESFCSHCGRSQT